MLAYACAVLAGGWLASTAPRAGPRDRFPSAARPDVSIGRVPGGGAADPPLYVLKVRVIRTCNDDGTNCSTATKAQVQAGLDATNEVHARSNSGIQFVIDPQTDFTGFIKRTNLNTDCLIPPGVTPENVTKQDVNGDGTVDEEDTKLICDSTVPAAERTALALEFPHSVVVYVRGMARSPLWDADAGHWVIKVPTGGFSSCAGEYVAARTDFGGGTFFAHESGHYLCSPHTFGSTPADVAAAAAKIKSYIEAKAIDPDDPTAVLEVFDADRSASIEDTPPDPGPTIFSAVYGDPCDPAHGTVTVPVTLSNNVTKVYTLAPARDNVMSYFKSCPAPTFQQHFTPDQVKRHVATLTGRRKALLESEPRPCYSSGGLYRRARGETVLALIQSRAAIIARCVKLYRRPRPGEIYMDQIYSNPASVLKASLQESQADRLQF